MKIVFIGEYLLSFPGGAERSMFHILKDLSKKHDVKCYTFDPYISPGERTKEGIWVKNFGLRYELKFSRIVEIGLNKHFVRKTLKSIKSEIKGADYVITQSLLSPEVAIFCKDNNMKYKYFIRDENNLNIFPNYENGFRKILKVIKNLIEAPFRIDYCIKNSFALKNAKEIFTASKFIAKLLKEKFDRTATVIYPYIDKSKLKKTKKGTHITFIGGGDARKGWDIVEAIINRLPEKKFLIVGFYKEKFTKDNVTYMPFQKDLTAVYNNTKVLLFPSRVNEGYGRIVAEGNHLKIPTITSNRGGIPEANPNKKLIIKDLDDIDAWVKKIEEVY